MCPREPPIRVVAAPGLGQPAPLLRAQAIDPSRSTDVAAVTVQSRLLMGSIGAPIRAMLPRKGTKLGMRISGRRGRVVL